MHFLEIQVEDVLNSEDLILREEDGMDEDVTHIEIDKGDKRKDNGIEIRRLGVKMNLISLVVE